MDEAVQKVEIFKIIMGALLTMLLMLGSAVAYLWMTERKEYALLLFVIAAIVGAVTAARAAARESKISEREAIKLGQTMAHETLREGIRAIVENDKQDVREMEAMASLVEQTLRLIRDEMGHQGKQHPATNADDILDDNTDKIRQFPQRDKKQSDVVNM